MAILIVVQGRGNSGKTSSIGKFLSVHRGVQCKPLLPPHIVLPIQKGGNSYLLGVGKNGDDAKAVCETLELFSEFNCDIVVCATKSQGNSVEALDLFLADNKDIDVRRVNSRFIAKGGDCTTANSAVAAEIESHIP